ncbi:MAG: HDIG domain-containing protein [Nitrososphaeria archaeon]
MENKANRRRIRKAYTLISDGIEELKKHGCNRYIIDHCILVTKISQRIVNALERSGIKVNDIEVIKGSILHDIGRSKEHSVRHGFLGGEILRKGGYDEAIVKIVERHVGGGISKLDATKFGMPERDFIPSTLEEKIVCIADKYVEDNQIKPLSVTLEKFESMLGKGNETNLRILQFKREIENSMGKSIESLIGI